MKTIISITLLFCSVLIHGQRYQVKEDVMVLSLTPTATPTDAVMGFIKDRTASSLQTQLLKRQYLTEIASVGNDVFFKDDSDSLITMTESDCKKIMEEVKGKWGFGIMTLPIKVRLEGGREENLSKRYFNFEGGFNLGLAVTRRFWSDDVSEIKKFFVVSINTSQVKVSSETTNKFVPNEESNMAFSPTGGFIFQFKNDLQLIAVVGIDYLSGKVGSEWVYRGKPFYGIGIGFAAFQFGEKPTK